MYITYWAHWASLYMRDSMILYTSGSKGAICISTLHMTFAHVITQLALLTVNISWREQTDEKH